MNPSFYQLTPLEIFHGRPFIAGSQLNGGHLRTPVFSENYASCQVSGGGNLLKIRPSRECHDSYIEAFQLSPYTSCSIIKLSANSGHKLSFDGNDLMGFCIGLSGRSYLPSLGSTCVEQGNPFGALVYAPPEAQVTIESNNDSDYQAVSIVFKKSLIEQALGMGRQELPRHLSSFLSHADKGYQLQSLKLPYRSIELATEMLNSQEESNLRYMQLLSLANTMMFEFLRSLSIDDTTQTNKDVKSLARAKSLLEQNLSAQYSLQQLAKEVGLCRTKLVTGFKDQYGSTVADYHREVRLKEAYRLVRQTEKTFAIIADETGFSSSNHFATCFKKRFQKTPSEIRKLNIELRGK
ncbi:helix-turn-helix transcriptional regulator [Pseudomaricurvus alkylphenolicus]|uniref:helix-turn-helix domain-containing protein n=1 Tax=Pseudomaricurvus alkylphenolicus TaxID=1306991 RepID=UPI00142494A5|nr:AraC family transcriptional regulator [Pseudomaricurvus alkylphenolicus]NIB38148.1 helix-turn-helix transcriptional regulator [Pseudomaricurvus alkylphenolicus]